MDRAGIEPVWRLARRHRSLSDDRKLSRRSSLHSIRPYPMSRGPASPLLGRWWRDRASSPQEEGGEESRLRVFHPKSAW